MTLHSALRGGDSDSSPSTYPFITLSTYATGVLSPGNQPLVNGRGASTMNKEPGFLHFRTLYLGDPGFRVVVLNALALCQLTFEVNRAVFKFYFITYSPSDFDQLSASFVPQLFHLQNGGNNIFHPVLPNMIKLSTVITGHIILPLGVPVCLICKIKRKAVSS